MKQYKTFAAMFTTILLICAFACMGYAHPDTTTVESAPASQYAALNAEDVILAWTRKYQDSEGWIALAALKKQ